MESVGVDEDEQRVIFRTLSAILLLGNIEYGEDEKEQVMPQTFSILRVCRTITNALKSCRNAVFKDEGLVEKIASLIECPMLRVRLLQREIRAGISSKSKRRSSVPIVKLNVNQAVDARNALAKSMYDKIFSHLVSRVNDSLKSTVRAETCKFLDDCFARLYHVTNFTIIRYRYSRHFRF